MNSLRGGFLRRPIFWLFVCVAISFVVLAYPLYVIRPFRYQGPHELAAALVIIRFRPFLEIAFVIAALIIFVFSWRRSVRWFFKAAASVCTLLVVLFAVLSHVNVYELMFHPLDNPTFSSASKSKLDGGEEVIAIRVGTAARDYPVRSMSYHHIVNDVLGGLPIVATY
jgi:fatty acid desaturase